MAENVKVICRVRPLNSNEVNKKSTTIVSYPGKNSISVTGKTYTFDGVLTPTSTQEEVYEIAGTSVVENVLSGYNGTLFAYGQTASGKTYTMIGKTNDEKLKGIIPRIVHSLFDHIRKLTGNLSFLIRISYLEIYLERIRDLLDISKDNLPICEDLQKSTYVKGATERYISSPEEVFDALDEGKVNRKTAQTAMNLDSSRSHSIFCFYISQEDNVTKKKLYGRLYLVDLAGSEKVSKTAAEGQTLEEAKNINKSLSSLGNVINALVEGSGHIPYRDSKLTRMLQESLGGNAKTTMIICVSPASYNEAETKSTILFGSRVKTIKNIVMVNMELSTEEWKKQYMDLRALYTELLSQYEILDIEVKRWRAGEKIPQSDWAKAYSGKMKEDPFVQDIVGQMKTDTRRTMDREDVQTKDLYKDLDVKDEEIALLTQNLRKLENELHISNDQIVQLTKEKDGLNKTNGKIQVDLDRAVKDLRDVLPALEEMAANLSQKTKELDVKRKEVDSQQEIIDKLQVEVSTNTNQINSLKDGEISLKKIIFEIFNDIKQDLLFIAKEMNESLIMPNSPSNKLEEELNGMKIFVSKIKGETKNFTNKSVSNLTGKDAEPYKKIEILQKQIETNRKNFEDSFTTILTDKNKLESQLFQLKREVIKTNTDSKLAVIKDAKVVEKIQSQVKQMVEGYISDLSEAKHEANERLKENQELKDKLDLAHTELEVMHKSGLGLDTQVQIDKREQTKNELRGLEDNINRELITLNTLRKLFLNDLRTKITKITQKASVKEMLNDNEDEFLSTDKLTPHQRERMNFLENNLENLTKVHKKLVRENADLRSDFPKLERKLKASSERIKHLEQALKEAKESSLKDRRKYQSEVDRIKETIRNKNMTTHVVIAKPIQAGGGEPTPEK